MTVNNAISPKRHLVTSALPYVNAVKHLGNLVGSMLPADVYARFLRAKGEEVLFICATDDHGTPSELGAVAANMSVEDFCTQNHNKQKEVYQGFKLSFDHFGRTSRPQNHEITQYLFQKLDENGYIEERTIKQLYSEVDKRFLPDRYVEGTCPHCGYEKARGDQCENCTKVLDPTDLLCPYSAISGSTKLEIRETKHLFIKLEDLQDKIRSWVDKQTHWSKLVSSIAYKWLDEGLQNRCITRDLYWGVKVPKEGFEDKVFYVWFDAPVGYMAATKEWSDIDPSNRNWKDWWYDVDDEVIYTQFMGKDNIPFHNVMFPATLLGSGEPWKMVNDIKGFSWLTYYGGKFSTSQQLGVFTNDALQYLPSDYWRYYLMSRVPESADSAFTWGDLQSVINKDLADVLGNYVNRLLQFCSKKFGNEIPDGGEWSAKEQQFAGEIDKIAAKYSQFLEEREFRKAIAELRALWVAGNGYLAESAPWSEFKENPERAACILRTGINFISIIARLSRPIIPDTADKLADCIGIKLQHGDWVDGNAKELLQALPAGHKFTIPEVLFKKIEDEDVAKFEEIFGIGGGKQADKIV